MAKKAKAVLLLAFLISSSAISEENTYQEQKNITGRWSPDCEKTTGIYIESTKEILIEVNSNQIYISAHAELNNKNFTIYLTNPNELGRGGLMLDWENFSRESPIAKLAPLSEKSARFSWFGFYNTETKSYEWKEEPSFMIGKKDIFFKCEY